MPRSWGELLGEDGASAESEAEQQGFLGRLRDSLGRSRRALTEQLEVAVFDPSDEAAWERLEEALITADGRASARENALGSLSFAQFSSFGK